MTDPIILTNINQLPTVNLRAIVAPDFLTAIAEMERKYGAWAAAWYYRGVFYFEAKP